MFCYWTKSEIHGFVGGLVYMVHTLLACTLLALCTGALGFLSAYSVVRKIYAAVKVQCPDLARLGGDKYGLLLIMVD